MTTSTKRPDGDELLTVARAAFEWIDSIPLTVVASLPAMPGIDRDWANVVMDRAERATPTNESPAPQIDGPWDERLAFAICEELCAQLDEGVDETRMLAVKVVTSSRVKAVYQSMCTPASQPPVEGLRGILENLDTLDGQRTPGPWKKTHDNITVPLSRNLVARCDADWSGFSVDMAKASKNARFIVALENAWPKIRAALASPSLTAEENTKSDGGEHGGERTRTVQAGLDEGLGPMQAVPQAADACSAPSDPPLEDALGHLGSVLSILAELHPDDRSRALDNALAFYNARRPGAQVEPVAGVTRLVHQWPGPSDPSPTAPAFDVMQTIDPDYAESFERSLDLPQSAPLIGPSHNSGERLPIDKAESGADTPPTASAPDVREASERVLQSLNALASGLLSPDQNETSTAMASEASQAIDDAIIVNDFLAALSQQPVAVADREAIAGEFEPVGTQYLHYSPFTGHEVWLDRDFYNGHRATVSREVFARKSALALLHPQPAKGER